VDNDLAKHMGLQHLNPRGFLNLTAATCCKVKASRFDLADADPTGWIWGKIPFPPMNE